MNNNKTKEANKIFKRIAKWNKKSFDNLNHFESIQITDSQNSKENQENLMTSENSTEKIAESTVEKNDTVCIKI